jgi:hypothetical protein
MPDTPFDRDRRKKYHEEWHHRADHSVEGAPARNPCVLEHRTGRRRAPYQDVTTSGGMDQLGCASQDTIRHNTYALELKHNIISCDFSDRFRRDLVSSGAYYTYTRFWNFSPVDS